MITWSQRSPPTPPPQRRAKGGWWRIGMEGKLFSPPTTPTPKESQGRLTESQQRIDQMTIVRLTFSEMHQEVKRWHVLPLLNAEVSGATSLASLSYLCQVTAREQSKEQWCWDHISVIPQLRKVTETIYRNLDSLPVISILHNKPLSPEEKSTFILRRQWDNVFLRPFGKCVSLPGRIYISADSCSLDGCLLCQGKHRIYTTDDNMVFEQRLIKSVFADVFLILSSRKYTFHLHYFHWEDLALTACPY